MGNWFDTGFDGTSREEQQQEAKSGPRRLYLKTGESKEIVFIDDDPFCIHEHNPKINDTYRNWFTCLRGAYPDEAVCCEILGDDTRYYVGYFTVVDCSRFEWKGNVYQYEVKFLPVKLKMLKLLKLRKEDSGSLVGRMFRVTRLTDKSANTGDDFSFKKEVDMAKLLTFANYKGKKLLERFAKAKDDAQELARLQRLFQLAMNGGIIEPRLVPFNYMELLKPRAPKDVRLLLKGQQLDDDDDEEPAKPETPAGAREDEVPF